MPTYWLHACMHSSSEILIRLAPSCRLLNMQVTLYLKSRTPFCCLENGTCVHLNINCCMFTGTFAKTKKLIIIRVKNGQMFTKSYKKVGKLPFPPEREKFKPNLLLPNTLIECASFSYECDSKQSLLMAPCLRLTLPLGLILCNFITVKPIATEIFYRLTVPSLYGLCINNINPNKSSQSRGFKKKKNSLRFL